MALNYPSQGELNAGAYSISATPFVTSSVVAQGQTKEINFGFASKFIVVRNTSDTATLAISFTENGLKPENSNYFILSGSESFSGDFRTDRLFVSGSGGGSCNFSIVSGLTLVPSRNTTTITGSNGFPGVG